jgi:tRNA/tmRNA/rRNA uracil-C5-methylase (TrmA/RlmC/RlmD family)
LYAACNPAILARVTELLREAYYGIKKISLVDQYPHTSHIETVVLFEKK